MTLKNQKRRSAFRCPDPETGDPRTAEDDDPSNEWRSPAAPFRMDRAHLEALAAGEEFDTRPDGPDQESYLGQVLAALDAADQEQSALPAHLTPQPVYHRDPSTGRVRAVRMPMTAGRVAVFLRTLAETGSYKAASRAASPHQAHSLGAGSGAFLDLEKRDPVFAEAVQAAKDMFMGAVEAEITRRAFTPTRRPVVSQGEILGYEEKYDNNLLVRLAAANDPARWGQKAEVHHSGTVAAGVMVVPGVAGSPEDWAKKWATPAPPPQAPSGTPQLPPTGAAAAPTDEGE